MSLNKINLLASLFREYHLKHILHFFINQPSCTVGFVG